MTKNITVPKNVNRYRAFAKLLFQGIKPWEAAERLGMSITEIASNQDLINEVRMEALSILHLEILPLAVKDVKEMFITGNVRRDKVTLSKLILDKAGIGPQTVPTDKAPAELSLPELHALVAKLEGKMRVVDQKAQEPIDQVIDVLG